MSAQLVQPSNPCRSHATGPVSAVWACQAGKAAPDDCGAAPAVTHPLHCWKKGMAMARMSWGRLWRLHKSRGQISMDYRHAAIAIDHQQHCPLSR